MVIVIHQSAHTQNALHYNEKKVKEGVATFFDSLNTLSVNPFMYDEKHRMKNLLDIEKVNTRVKKKCLHISFNPSVEDYQKLGDKTIRLEIRNMMEHLGYGNQPYFVYQHQDLERVHFHVVSTRIDKVTGRKIKDNYEKEKLQRFVKSLEEKYQLVQKTSKEHPVFRFSPRSRNIRQNLEELFKHLNRMPEVTSKEMYNEALKLFNVEIKKSGRGHIVLVTDGEGNPIRYPIRLSNFKERPKFYQVQKEELVIKTRSEKENYSQKNQETVLSFSIIRNLVKLIPENYSKERNQKLRIKRKRKGRQRRY
jgi:hypothetical protein